MGILNAHPAKLPDYRGVDVVRWSIFNNDSPGVLIHFIDQCIDTGSIVCVEEIQIKPGEKINDIKIRVEIRAGALMAKCVKTLIETGVLKIQRNNPENGKRYYQMDKAKQKIVDRKLAEIGSR